MHMEVSKGDLVLSCNGRDQGKALYVADIDGAYLILVDGKSRKIEHPKRKKEKHCKFLARDDSRVAEKLRTGERVANIDIRRALATFLAGAAQEEQSKREEA